MREFQKEYWEVATSEVGRRKIKQTLMCSLCKGEEVFRRESNQLCRMLTRWGLRIDQWIWEADSK